MIVWVLLIVLTHGSGSSVTTAAVTVDNIATAASCSQLAVVYRRLDAVRSATCAPVKKVRHS